MGRISVDPDRVRRFRADLAFLENVKEYKNKDIAARMGISGSNLSSYKSARSPGEETINKLYMEFGKEIPKDGYENKGESPQSEEPNEQYDPKNPQEFIKHLQVENEFLRHTHQMYLETDYKKADAFQTMANAQNDLSKGMLTLIEANKKLTDQL